MPPIHEVRARTISRLSGIVDPWFLARYGMNLYRGCAHGCAYCDGRAERYRVPGDFRRDIQVKVNALEVLDRELSRLREPGFLFVGGGVTDAWQPVEARYGLARGVLELALARELPVHVLTKGSLVERDLDLLSELSRRHCAVLSFSIQTADESVRERFEPGAAPLETRWRLLQRASRLGIATGVALMPVLPGISDTSRQIDRVMARAADAGVDFVLCGDLTLRPGTQKSHFLEVLGEHHPELLAGYDRLYRRALPSGAGDSDHHRRVHERFARALARHRLPSRMPRRLFTGRMPQYAELGVLLEHRGAGSGPGGPLGRAGYALQSWARRRLGRRGLVVDVERELHRRLADGSLVSEAGLPPGSLTVLQELAATLPALPPDPQLGLFAGGPSEGDG